jgi:hypothetical protein
VPPFARTRYPKGRHSAEGEPGGQTESLYWIGAKSVLRYTVPARGHSEGTFESEGCGAAAGYP